MTSFTEDIIIGLEVHVELNTQTKLFCPCPTQGSEVPNTRTCPTCLGHPGAKPVPNKAAIEKALLLALALNCNIAPQVVFSRKTYFYPDLAKNYQITQYEEPLGEQGHMNLEKERTIGIERVHIEEDPASLVHGAQALVDYNRSGNPLAELVTKPEMYSPEEARAFMKKLHTILRYLEIFDEESGIIKADANISIKESGYKRVEIKNITGFKEIERALFAEVDRQKQAVRDNEPIILETRGWDAIKGLTFSMRKKESEADYGYIIDTDLAPIDLDPAWIAKLEENLPELAESMTNRFEKLGVDPIDAKVLAENKDIANLFDEVRTKINAKKAAQWMRREVLRVLNYAKLQLSESKITATNLIELLEHIEQKKITEKTAQKLMEQMVKEEFSVSYRIQEEGLGMVQDTAQVKAWCEEVITEQPEAIEQIKAGDTKPFNFLLGQVMRKSKGKASPQEIKTTLESLLK